MLRVISDGFLAPIHAFSKKSPTIFTKHMPSGIGTESLGMIGCIFVENGPLEGGIESSFWGTGWGAKGDFIRYSYLYPYIFESRTHTFFETHALSYTHSKVGNDQMHIRGEMTSGNWTLSGFVRSRPESLWWFEVDFWPLSVHFTKGAPHHFQKTHALRYGHRKFGNDRMYICGEWALRMWHWIKFQWYRLGC